MKRIPYCSILFIAAVTFFFTSCNKKNPVSVNSIEFTQSYATYWGDYYGTGYGIFDLILNDNQLASSRDGDLNGIQVIFDLNASSGTSTIPAGTYNSGTSGNVFTYQRGDYNSNGDPIGSYFRIWKNNKVSNILLLTSGKLYIEKNGNYKITGQVTTEDNEQYEFSYRGTIITSDVTPWPETLTKGQIIYNGRNSGTNRDYNIFTILLGGNNVTFPGLGGDDDAMKIELNSPINATNTIMNGTYVVQYEAADIYTIMDGYVGNDNNDYGTWYYTSEYFSIQSGDMIVTISNNHFTLDFIFYTGTGMPIKSVFEGNLYYTAASPAPALIKRVPGKQSATQRIGREKTDNKLVEVYRTTDSNNIRSTKAIKAKRAK